MFVVNKPNGTPQKKLDVSLINQLGWKSRISLQVGLKLTIKEYLLLMSLVILTTLKTPLQDLQMSTV